MEKIYELFKLDIFNIIVQKCNSYKNDISKKISIYYDKIYEKSNKKCKKAKVNKNKTKRLDIIYIMLIILRRGHINSLQKRIISRRACLASLVFPTR